MSAANDREELLAALYDRGIRNEALFRAMASLNRQDFVDLPFRGRAWKNEALPIECGQTISQPMTVAVMTDLIDPQENARVLEIGTGSGYQAAVLASMGARVWSVERHQDLLETARKRLDVLGLQVGLRVADGTVGWSEYGPYDGIVVTAGAPSIPKGLRNQLAIGGRLVIPVGPIDKQRLILVRRDGPEDFVESDHGEARFVPLVGKRGWAPADA